MKVFVLLVAAIVTWMLVWKALVKHWRSKGWGALISHVSACLSGFVVSIIPFLTFAPGNSEQGAAPVSADVPASESAASVRSEALSKSDAQSASSGEVPPVLSLTEGASNGAANADNWPKAATITLSQSEDEKRYLADQTCLDESECYGPKRFQRYIVKRYPDLASVRYHALADEADDNELVSTRKENFFQSLYFAKQIQLANGQSLYDFLRSCSRGFTSLDAAEVGYDSNAKISYFDIQYFPTLRRAGTDEPVELQILFERRGDKLLARSPFFTTNALRYADFLRRHNVTCWSNRPDAA